MSKKLFWIIIILALALRLAGLRQGYWYNHDTARDILVARGAITLGLIPWVGSFSSAGPFVFGPQWYWFLVIINLFFPHAEIAVPLAVIVVSLGTLIVLTLTANKIAGKGFAVITGLFLAISPYVISSSWTVSQHGMTIFFSSLALFSVVSFLKKPSLRYGFLLGFAVGTAASLHTQAVTLTVLFLPPFLFLRKDFPKMAKLAVVILVGLLLGSSPYLYWDSLIHFRNTKNILDYLLIGQYRFYVPNRWLTYIFDFWAGIFADFIGSPQVGGIIIMAAIFVSFIWGLVKRSLNKEILTVLFFFLFDFVLFRYYRGPRFRGYFLFLDPAIGLLLSWVLYILFKINRTLLVIAFLALSLSTLVFSVNILSRDNVARGLFDMRNYLTSHYPGEKFTVYTNHPNAGACSFNLALILDSANLTTPHGRPLGVCLDSPEHCSSKPVLISANYLAGDKCYLLDLTNDTNFLAKKGWWHDFDKRALFDEIENWWRKT